MEEAHFTEGLCSSLHCYAKEEMPPLDYPLSYNAIGTGHAKDKQILKILQKKDSPYHLVRIVNWCHNYLGHPVINGTEETIGQHLWWPNMRKHTTLSVSTLCKNCQQNKCRHKKYKQLPEKEAEAMPQDKRNLLHANVSQNIDQAHRIFFRNASVQRQMIHCSVQHRRTIMVLKISLAQHTINI
jgi:hypothetical protein